MLCYLLVSAHLHTIDVWDLTNCPISLPVLRFLRYSIVLSSEACLPPCARRKSPQIHCASIKDCTSGARNPVVWWLTTPTLTSRIAGRAYKPSAQGPRVALPVSIFDYLIGGNLKGGNVRAVFPLYICP